MFFDVFIQQQMPCVRFKDFRSRIQPHQQIGQISWILAPNGYGLDTGYAVHDDFIERHFGSTFFH